MRTSPSAALTVALLPAGIAVAGLVAAGLAAAGLGFSGFAAADLTTLGGLAAAGFVAATGFPATGPVATTGLTVAALGASVLAATGLAATGLAAAGFTSAGFAGAGLEVGGFTAVTGLAPVPANDFDVVTGLDVGLEVTLFGLFLLKQIKHCFDPYRVPGRAELAVSPRRTRQFRTLHVTPLYEIPSSGDLCQRKESGQRIKRQRHY